MSNKDTTELDKILFKFHGRVFIDGDIPQMSYLDEAREALLLWRDTEVIKELEELSQQALYNDFKHDINAIGRDEIQERITQLQSNQKERE